MVDAGADRVEGSSSLGRGAEAVLFKQEQQVVKKRVKKGYRHPKIDRQLRQDRTDLELKLLEKARRAGVNVPQAERKSDYELSLDFLPGQELKQVLNEQAAGNSNKREADYRHYLRQAGEAVAKLHARDVIHGDLTTSNLFVVENRLYLIDFGLGFFSQREEDKATDLNLLRQDLQAAHPSLAEESFQAFKGSYKNNYEQGKKILERLKDVESRGRYK